MKYFFSFAIAIFLLISPLQAQISSSATDWHPGIVIINDQQILKGDISYDYAHDLVMCKSENRLQTLSPHQVQSFKYFEEEKNLFHEFIVLEQKQNEYYSQKGFFEVVLEGDINYVRKRNRFPDFNERKGYTARNDPRSNHHLVCYDYYVQYEGQLIDARKFKRKVLPEMLRKEESLQDYIKANNLRVYDIGDQIVLVDYYNVASHSQRQANAKTTNLKAPSYGK